MKFKNFVLLGLHTELWVEAPTSQPKTDGTGKSEAFGDNLVETALEWKHCASLLFLSTPVPLPMVFRSFLPVCLSFVLISVEFPVVDRPCLVLARQCRKKKTLLCLGLLSVLCFVLSSSLARSVFVCENPCDRDTMGHRSKTRILDPPTFAHFALRLL